MVNAHYVRPAEIAGLLYRNYEKLLCIYIHVVA